MKLVQTFPDWQDAAEPVQACHAALGLEQLQCLCGANVLCVHEPRGGNSGRTPLPAIAVHIHRIAARVTC